MDPNAALKYLDSWDCCSEQGWVDMIERFVALRNWISRGGWEPNWNRYPRGHKLYIELLSLQDV